MRGLGEACAAGCVGQGRRARPGARARGAVARAAGANRGRRSREETVAGKKRERERERGTVEKENVTLTNGIESWASGVRDREKIFGI